MDEEEKDEDDEDKDVDRDGDREKEEQQEEDNDYDHHDHDDDDEDKDDDEDEDQDEVTCIDRSEGGYACPHGAATYMCAEEEPQLLRLCLRKRMFQGKEDKSPGPK